MLDDARIARLRKRFQLYSSSMIEADSLYYQSIDSSFFLRIAAQFDASPYQTPPDEVGLDLLPDNLGRFDSTKAAFLRFIRYLASERMILTLVSGYPFGPTPKFLQEARYDVVRDLMAAISARKVPNGFECDVEGGGAGFKDWLRVLFFRDEAGDSVFLSQVEDFVVREATLLKDREAINAFKHGRFLSAGSGTPVSVRLKRSCGEDVELIRPMNGALTWVGWSERSSGNLEHTLSLCWQEVDGKADYEIIKSVSAVERLIVQIRRAELLELSEVEVFIPDLDDMVRARSPQSVSLTMKTHWKAGRQRQR